MTHKELSEKYRRLVDKVISEHKPRVFFAQRRDAGLDGEPKFNEAKEDLDSFVMSLIAKSAK